MLRVDDRSSVALASLHRPQRSRRMAFCVFSAERSNGLGSAIAQPEGTFVVSLQPGLADELAGKTHRAEALIVKVIGQPIRANSLQTGRRQARRGPASRSAHDHEETIAPEVLRTVRMRQPADRLELEAGIRAAGDAGPSWIVRYWIVCACRSLRPP